MPQCKYIKFRPGGPTEFGICTHPRRENDACWKPQDCSIVKVGRAVKEEIYKREG